MAIRELIDPEKGRVSGLVFSEEEIYQQELEKVWSRTWVFLAHDSMLPKAGSYIQSYIAEDPVVVCRQKDGSVKAFLNQCRHRGMRICRADRGVAKSFMCSFHGWAYDIAGNLIQVPHESNSYPMSFDKANFGARPVPRLVNYKGFWFGSWDPDIIDFEEYLGDGKYYLDGYIDRYDDGMEVISTHKWVLPNNWKLFSEQATSDMQHSEISHVSAAEVLNKSGQTSDRTQRKIEGRQFYSRYGHGGAWFGKRGEEVPNTGPALLGWERENQDQIVNRLGSDREVRGHMNIFPNFMVLGNQTLRVNHPRGPHEMEVWSWAFVPKSAPESVKNQIRLDVMRTFSPAGMFEQDDAENWQEAQRILRGYQARHGTFAYQMVGVRPGVDEDEYPGTSTGHVYSDYAAINFYSFYRDIMSASDWAELKATRAADPLSNPVDLAAAK